MMFWSQGRRAGCAVGVWALTLAACTDDGAPDPWLTTSTGEGGTSAGATAGTGAGGPGAASGAATTGSTTSGGVSTGGASTGSPGTTSTSGTTTSGGLSGSTGATAGTTGSTPTTSGVAPTTGGTTTTTSGELPDGGGTGLPDADTSGDAEAPDPVLEEGVWIAPDGDDQSAGTREEPFRTLGRALEGAGPGTLIWVSPGQYDHAETVAFRSSGTEDAPLRVFAAPGERPVFDFAAQSRGDSSARGFSIPAKHVHLRGFDVVNAGDNCIHISGSHNTLEHLVTSGCSDTGVQITAGERDNPESGGYNVVLNCDSYENYDAQNQGENADGFAAKLYIGPGNVFRGCRAWNNADDGWDLFQGDDVVVIEDCWAVSNGKIGPGQNNTNGDGNGFKLGGRGWAGNDQYQGGAVHEVRRSYSVENRTCGFTRNNNPEVPHLSECGGRGDGRGTYCSLSGEQGVEVTATAAQVLALERDSEGNLPPL